jgi:magnesium-transporting ATPase (P-type)
VQFQRFANFFYLIISIISAFPEIWPPGPVANAGPLAFVLLVTAFKEAYEDYNRHKADAIMNGTPVKVFDGGRWVETTWAKVSPPLVSLPPLLSATHFRTDYARAGCQAPEQRSNPG